MEFEYVSNPMHLSIFERAQCTMVGTSKCTLMEMYPHRNVPSALEILEKTKKAQKAKKIPTKQKTKKQKQL